MTDTSKRISHHIIFFTYANMILAFVKATIKLSKALPLSF